MTFRVRLGLELDHTHSASDIGTPIEVVVPGNAGAWVLKEISARSALRGQRLDLRGPPVESDAEALALGQRAQAALMAVAIQRGFGIILTERQPTGTLFNAGRELIAGDRWDRLLDDVAGLTVYEDSGRVGFVGMGPVGLRTGSPASRLLEEWSNLFPTVVVPPEGVLTAFDLWASSRSENSSRARLLLLVMAVEALAQQCRRPPDEQAVVSALVKQVQDSSLAPEAKERLCAAVALLQNESIGRTCRGFIARRVGQSEAELFRKAYRVRNTIAHGGRPPGARVLVEHANALEPTVKALLLRELGVDAA